MHWLWYALGIYLFTCYLGGMLMAFHLRRTLHPGASEPLPHDPSPSVPPPLPLQDVPHAIIAEAA